MKIKLRIYRSLTYCISLIFLFLGSNCKAAEIKVLTAGAFKPVLLAIQKDFEKKQAIT